MTDRFDRQLRMGYGFSILILLVVGLVSWFTLHTLLNSNRAVTHSGEVMQKLEELLSTMKDAETGQRGYLLSGQNKYLEPYNGAYNKALRFSDELQQLTADNSLQQANMNIIRDILRRRLDILQELVAKKKQGQLISASDLDKGKSAMDSFRKAVAKAQYDEHILLQERNEKLLHYAGLAPAFILFALVMTLGITVYSYRNVTRDVRERERLRRELEQSEKETQALNEELTAANEEITAANEELTSINEELSEARDELAMSNNTLEQRVEERTKALQESEGHAQALNEELTAINEEMTATNEELMATNEELAESQQQLRTMVDDLTAAEERSAKLVAIVESSDDAIIGKDLEGNITAWNYGAQQIFGYSEAEIVGHSILIIVPEERHHEEPLILNRLRNGEKVDHFETIRRGADGRIIDVSLTISPIRDKAGRVIGISKIARDITEQKQNEQRKSDFIGMASHELKTPLTSVNALVQVLQKKLSDSEDRFVPQALAKVNLQIKKMTGLINGFLNVSRLESGKLEIVKQSFDIMALITEELDEIRLTATSHTFIFDQSTVIYVNADREKIASVISNLLSNAVKYSPKGKLIKLRLEQKEKNIQVSVQDEGMGIRPQDLPRIFDRYYRSDSEHTKHISGFGVGLYLSSEIIKFHGGEIWAKSEKGVGSIFSFTLPLAN